MNKTALIVEDHPIFRNALLAFMKGLLGEANVIAVNSAEEALGITLADRQIDVVLLDFGLPGINGVEAVVALKRRLPTVSIIVLSATEERREVDAALRAGAVAFVSKAVSITVIADLVTKVLNGEEVAAAWITAHGSHAVSADSSSNLTPREHETLVLLCQGLSNKEIGLRLGLAEVTVKMNVSRVFRKLGVINRTQAVLTARKLGIGNGGNGSNGGSAEA